MDTLFTFQGIDMNKILDGAVKWLLNSGFHILLILIIAGIGLRIGQLFIQRSLKLALRDTGKDLLTNIQTGKRWKTLDTLFVTILRLTVFILAGLMIFRELGFEIGPILASAGIVGIAIGFGAQSLVKDMITGAFIVLEHQFDVGDVVQIGNHGGVVERLGTRTTTLRDDEGIAHIIPNGKIETVKVMTKGWSQLLLDLDVTYDTDIDRALVAIEKVLKDYAHEFSSEVIGEPQVLGIESLSGTSVKIRSTVKTAPGKQWDAGRIIRRRIKEVFESNGIQLPFQQSLVWVHPGR